MFAVALAQLARHAALGGVHREPFASAQVAHHRITGNGPTAWGVLDRCALAAVQQHQAMACVFGAGGKTPHGQGDGIGPLPSFHQQPGQALGHDGGNLSARADVGEQLAAVAAARPSHQGGPGDLGWRVVAAGVGHDQAFRSQGLREQALAHQVTFFLLQRLEEVPNLGACTPRAHEVQPGRVGLGTRRGGHLHHVAAAQLGAQRHRFAIDLRGHAMVAHIGVDGVGEVHRRRTTW